MRSKNIEKRHHQTFEQIREQSEDGREFWSARKLSKILEYSEYRHFLPVIERAKEACKNSGHNITDHFEDMLEMVEIGSGAKRKLEDLKLSRHNMGSTELAANLFRATQTEEKLRRETIKGKTKANDTHFEVGKKVRQTIKELGGTMPENLPTPEEDLKKIQQRVQSAEKKQIKKNKEA